MSVKIRLRRMGNKNRPFYRVVVADSRRSTTGKFIETLGYYDPVSAQGQCVLKLDRVDYWKGVGAVVSEKAAALIKRAIPYEKAHIKVEADLEAAATEENA